MDVDHWSSCLYVLNFDITAQVDIYFASEYSHIIQDALSVFVVR